MDRSGGQTEVLAARSEGRAGRVTGVVTLSTQVLAGPRAAGAVVGGGPVRWHDSSRCNTHHHRKSGQKLPQIRLCPDQGNLHGEKRAK